MKNNKKVLSALILLLSSCSVLGPVKTGNETNYTLNMLPHTAIHHTHAATLLVMPTDSNAIYGTTQMAYNQKPYQVAYYAKSRWADNPAKMLNQLIIQTLQNTHYFHAVVSSVTAGNYNYVLNTQLIELKQDYTQCPSAERLVLRAQLTRTSDNRIIATKQFSVSRTATQNTACGGVVAANYAAAEMLKQLSDFCTRRI
jgi:cholesterol transport system auxiliary component